MIGSKVLRGAFVFLAVSLLSHASVTLSSQLAYVSTAAGNGNFTLTMTPAATWSATSSAPWLTVTPASGTASGTVSFAYTANTAVRPRTATISIAGTAFAVAQMGTSGDYNPWGTAGYGTFRKVGGPGSTSTTSADNGDGGPASTASFRTSGVGADGNGNIYFIDRDRYSIRKIDASTGVLSTLAANVVSAGCFYAGSAGLAVDASGNIYASDCYSSVKRIDAVTRNVTTVAGGGSVTGASGDGGLATATRLTGPSGMAIAGNNLYIAESGQNRIRRINLTTGIITTVAGNGSQGFSGDAGPATSAALNSPSDVAVDSDGNLYIADSGNYRVRKVFPSGTIGTVAGNGGYITTFTDGASAIAVGLVPYTVAIDPQGNLILGDSRSAIFRVGATTGVITLIAGNLSGSCCATATEGGVAAGAALINIVRMAIDSAGNIYTGGEVLNFFDFGTPQGTFSPVEGRVGTAAGSGNVALTVAPATAPWLAISTVPWLTPGTASGTGSGTITYTVTANNAAAARSGVLRVLGRNMAVNQTGNGVTLIPGAATAGPSAGNGTIAMTTPATLAWTTASDSGWLTVSPASGTGNATLTFTVTANTTTSSRAGIITVAGRTIRVTQSGSTGVFTAFGTAGNVVKTIAGGGNGLDGSAAVSASLTDASATAVDRAGNLYIAERTRIRRVAIADGKITTIAGGGSAGTGDGGPATGAQLSSVWDLAIDSAGNLLFTDAGANKIRKVTLATGILTTIAGTGTAGFSGDFLPAAGSLVNQPRGLTLDAADNIYFCDSLNRRVRRIDAATGIITTIAGAGVYPGSGDGGPALAAGFDDLNDIVIDLQNNVFVSDGSNVRRVDAASGVITKLAGIANNYYRVWLATDNAGNLYAASDRGLYRVDPVTGTQTALGSTASGFAGDGAPLRFAQFQSILSVSTDAAGNLYVMDQSGTRVRFIDFTTPIVTLASSVVQVAGTAGSGTVALTAAAGAPWVASSNVAWLTITTASGSGPGTVAYSFSANGSVFGRTGVVSVGGQTLVVSQPGSAVTLSGSRALVSSVAGSGTVAVTVTPAAAWVARSSAAWLSVTPAAGTASGTVTYTYSANTSARAREAAITVAGKVFAVIQSGAVTGSTADSWVPWATGSAYGQIRRVAGNGAGTGGTGDYGPALNARTSIQAVSSDLNGNLYLADSGLTGNSWQVRKVDAATGVITPYAGTGAAGFGGDGGPALLAAFRGIGGLATGNDLSVYVSDQGNARIRRIDPVSGIITTIAGNGVASYGGDGGPATQASLQSPTDLVVDVAGNVYVNDAYRIRRIDGATGVITTVAGIGTYGSDGNGGLATQAQIAATGFAADEVGNLYVSDAAFRVVRKVSAATGIIAPFAGTGNFGAAGDGGPATSGSLRSPGALAIDPGGNLYIGDGAGGTPLIRRVDALTGVISTAAGNAGSGTDVDGGPALASPVGGSSLAIDIAGNLYTSDRSKLRATDFTTPNTVFSIPAVIAGTTASSGTVGVTAAAGQAWTAASNVPWLTLTGASGTGAGSIGYNVDANATPFTRTGVIRMNGQVFAVTQAGVPVTLSSGLTILTTAAGSGTFSIITSAAWTARSSAAWLTVTPTSGTGNATLTYSVAANSGADGRSAAITVAGRTFGVVQAGTQGTLTPWGRTIRGGLLTVAGLPWYGTASDGGPAVAASFVPSGVGVDASGSFRIADDQNIRIRSVDSGTRLISTFAGTGTGGSNGDGGSALTAQVYTGAMATDAAGNTFFSESQSGRIRRIDAATGVITTVAGGGIGGDGGPATEAALAGPGGLAVDGGGNIYFAETASHRVRRVDAITGVITTVAGTGTQGLTGNGGSAVLARLNNPGSVAIDVDGTVFIGDAAGVRKVDTGGTISVLSATSNAVPVLALNRQGTLYMSYSYGLFQLDKTTGISALVAGSTNYSSASFQQLRGIGADAGGNLYLADQYAGVIRLLDLVTPGVALGSSRVSLPATAGTGSVTLTVAPAGAAWQATSSANWVTLGTASGTGSGTLTYSWTANDLPYTRFATVAVMGQVLTLTQAGNPISASTVTVAPAGARVGPGAGSGTLQVTVNPAAAWTAVSNAAWLTVSPATSSAGSASVTYTFAANPGISARSAAILVAGKVFAVTQTGQTGAYTAWGSTVKGQLRTIAGNGTNSYSGDNGPATAAGLGLIRNQYEYFPAGTAVDGTGNLFIAEPESHRIRRVDAATGIIATVAGTGVPGSGGDGGPASTAQLNYPRDVKVDLAGNLYIADAGNNKIRYVDATTGTILTIAGAGSGNFNGDGGLATSAALNGPLALALDRNGNVLVADSSNGRIRKIDITTGLITTLAGNGSFSFGGDSGPATAASLNYPKGLVVDPAGNILIADDRNYRIRKVDAVTGTITTIAGGGSYSAAAIGDNGPATGAFLWDPTGVALDATGNMYVVEAGGRRVRRVDAADSKITTVAGSVPTANDSSPAGPLTSPTSISSDGAGNVYISDTGNFRIALLDMVSPTVTLGAQTTAVTSAAGTGTVSLSVSPTGAFWGAASDSGWLTVTSTTGTGNGSLTYSFSANTTGSLRTGTIRVYNQTLTVTQPSAPPVTFTASANPATTLVGATAGTATFALTMTPATAWQAASSAGWLTVSPASGTGNATISLQFTANSGAYARFATVTVAGLRYGVTQAGSLGSYSPYGSRGYGSVTTLTSGAYNLGPLTVDANGNLVYVYNGSYGTVSRRDAVTGDSTVVVPAVSYQDSSVGDGGPASQGHLESASGLATDAAGNLFISDSVAHRVRRVDAVTGTITTFAGTGAAGSAGDGGPATAALVTATGVSADPAGNVYLIDSTRNTIRKVSSTDNTITAFAGTGITTASGDGGNALQAGFDPASIATDGKGNVYVADRANCRIRRISPAGTISTVVGTGTAGFSGDGGPGTVAALAYPSDIAVDYAGNLFIADTGNNRIRRVDGITGIITTIAGDGSSGTATGSPTRVTVDAAGNVYYLGSSGIIFVDLASPQVTFATNPVNVSQPAGNSNTAFTLQPTGAKWTASSNVPWLSVTTLSGTGSGTVGYSYTANTSAFPRSGSVVIQGKSLQVTQAGIAVSFTPVAATATAAAGNGTVALTAGAGAAWTASVNVPWLTVSPATGSGSGTITYTFTANAGAGARTGAITVLGKTFFVVQAGTGGTYDPNYTGQGTTGAGQLRIIAGNGTSGFAGDGGPALQASFGSTNGGYSSTTGGVAVDQAGNVYVADTPNQRIRRIDAVTGIVSSIAGNGNCCGGDGGPAVLAGVTTTDLVVGPNGDLYLKEGYGTQIRKIEAASGLIRTIYQGDQVWGSPGMAVDGAGNIYATVGGTSI